MKCELKKHHRLVTKQFTWDLSQEEILDRLRRETWHAKPNENRPRMQLHEIQDPYLKRMLEYACDSEVLAPAIKMLYETNSANRINDWRWLEDPADMYACLKFHPNFFWDSPGYDNTMHLDPIAIPYTGMVYLTPDEDPNQGTRFYDYKNGDVNQPLEKVFEVPVHFGSGWIQANTYYSWHEGGNFTTSNNRYSIIYTSYFDLQPHMYRKKAYYKAIRRAVK
jgi:hypothetical protein